MITIVFILALTSFILTIAAAMNPPRVPLWIPVLVLSIALLMQTLPLR